MALLDLLGRRWALRILWEMRQGSFTFRVLRASCGEMSPSVLNQRLAELRAAGIVSLQEPGGYALTREGKILLREIGDLDAWAKRWARRVRRSRDQPALLNIS